jgi:hypothetical protein
VDVGLEEGTDAGIEAKLEKGNGVEVENGIGVEKGTGKIGDAGGAVIPNDGTSWGMVVGDPERIGEKSGDPERERRLMADWLSSSFTYPRDGFQTVPLGGRPRGLRSPGGDGISSSVLLSFSVVFVAL